MFIRFFIIFFSIKLLLLFLLFCSGGRNWTDVPAGYEPESEPARSPRMCFYFTKIYIIFLFSKFLLFIFLFLIEYKYTKVFLIYNYILNFFLVFFYFIIRKNFLLTWFLGTVYKNIIF